MNEFVRQALARWKSAAKREFGLQSWSKSHLQPKNVAWNFIFAPVSMLPLLLLLLLLLLSLPWQGRRRWRRHSLCRRQKTSSPFSAQESFISSHCFFFQSRCCGKKEKRKSSLQGLHDLTPLNTLYSRRRRSILNSGCLIVMLSSVCTYDLQLFVFQGFLSATYIFNLFKGCLPARLAWVLHYYIV